MSNALFTGPLGEQLRDRLVRAVAAADALLDQPRRADALAADPAALTESLTTLAVSVGESASVQLEHVAQLERLKARFERRAAAMAHTGTAVARLRRMTSSAALLEAAPRELAESAGFERVLLSVISEGTAVVHAVHLRGDPKGARQVRDALSQSPLRLDHALVETDALRRRRATLVTGAHLHPRVDRTMATAMGWESYVAAPVVVRSRPIALLHADRGSDNVDVLDSDVLWEFAGGLAGAYERASLRRTLRREREQMRAFLRWLDARSGELSEASVELAADTAPRLSPPESLDAAPAVGQRDDRAVFDGVITRRELDVLRLLAEGRTNRLIAAELVISPATVKFHVNGILRKLHVANRAEAVSRYFALMGMRSPEA